MLNIPAPEEGERAQVTPAFLESCITMAVIVRDLPAMTFCMPVRESATAIGVEEPHPATSKSEG